jgi:hypothetical protein
MELVTEPDLYMIVRNPLYEIGLKDTILPKI